MFKKSALVLFICLNLILCTSPQQKIEKAQENSPRYQYNMGLFHLNGGNIDEAIKYLNNSLSLNPRYDLALNALGLAYFMKRDFQEAIKYFQRCLQVNPALTEAHNNLGNVYQEMELLDEAEREYKTALFDESYSSKHLPYYNLARLYVTKNRPQEALEYIEKSLEINKRMVMTHNLRGIINEQLENFDEAIKSYEQALIILPGDVNLSFNLAVAYFKNSKFIKAKEIFEKIYPQTSDPEMKKRITEYLDKIKEQ